MSSRTWILFIFLLCHPQPPGFNLQAALLTVARWLLKFCVSHTNMQHQKEESGLSFLCVSQSEETFLGKAPADLSLYDMIIHKLHKPLRSGVGKLPPVGQIQPAAYFYMVCELIVVFTFLKGWKSQKKNNILWRENYMKFKFQCPKNFQFQLGDVESWKDATLALIRKKLVRLQINGSSWTPQRTEATSQMERHRCLQGDTGPKHLLPWGRHYLMPYKPVRTLN